ncbi:MAG: serine hydrolase [Xanthomonadales bacterium]|nr:serine hydrolase [Xanthomonadales bacterium]
MLVEQLDEVTPVCSVGSCYIYQNIAFSLIGDVTFAVTGDFFTHQVEKRIFHPARHGNRHLWARRTRVQRRLGAAACETQRALAVGLSKAHLLPHSARSRRQCQCARSRAVDAGAPRPRTRGARPRTARHPACAADRHPGRSARFTVASATRAHGFLRWAGACSTTAAIA